MTVWATVMAALPSAKVKALSRLIHSSKTWHLAKLVPRIPRFGHFAECICNSTWQMPSLPSTDTAKWPKITILIVYCIPTKQTAHIYHMHHIYHKFISQPSHASHISQISSQVSLLVHPSTGASQLKKHKCITTISKSRRLTWPKMSSSECDNHK
jgi:hypothetical protein